LHTFESILCFDPQLLATMTDFLSAMFFIFVGEFLSFELQYFDKTLDPMRSDDLPVTTDIKFQVNLKYCKDPFQLPLDNS
jgi:hypothetical protein